MWMKTARSSGCSKLLAFCKREAVLCIAFLCALVSMCFVPPSPAYWDYIDLRVLVLLFCLMAVVAGAGKCGLFHVLARRLLTGQRQLRLLVLVLVLLPFFTSMLITNDVALIAFVPFAVLVLGMVAQERYLIYVITLQTIAANLGSMATPLGNPQNLYLCSRFQIPAGDFFAAMAPLTLLSLVGLTAAALAVKGQHIQVSFPERTPLARPRFLAVLFGLFFLCLLSVFRVLPWQVLPVIVVPVLLVGDRQLLRRVDYGLLATFVCFFIFAGNLGEIPQVRQVLAGLLEHNAALTAALASQVISNVPAAVLLSGFTQDWRGLLIGTDVGGLGTLIASLASLISFKLYLRSPGARPLRYLGVFTAANLVGLLVLGCAAALLAP